MIKIKNIVAIFSMCMLLNTHNYVYAKDLTASKIVPSNKIWQIKFNKPLKLNENTISNITVKDSKGTKIDISLKLEKDNKTILITPKKEYNNGESYFLNISKDLISSKNLKLKEPINFKFSIENKDEQNVKKDNKPIENQIVKDKQKDNNKVDVVDKKELPIGKLGTSSGNIAFPSFVAEDSKNIYMIDGKQTFVKELYKMNKETKEISVFKDVQGDLQTVNSVNNKIYYLSSDKNRFYRDFIPFESKNISCHAYLQNLYEMNPDGSNKVNLIRGCGKFVATENYIFYNNELDDDNLYRYDLKNGKTQKIQDKYLHNFNIINNKLIYTNYLENAHNHLYGDVAGNIFVTNIDGSNKIKLTANLAHCLIPEGDYIYYINNSDNDKIYKISLDGKSTKVSDISAYYMNISNGWIYYGSTTDTTEMNYDKNSPKKPFPKIYKMKLDGTNNTKVSDNPCSQLNLVNNTIFFIEPSFDGYGVNFTKKILIENNNGESKLIDYIDKNIKK